MLRCRASCVSSVSALRCTCEAPPPPYRAREAARQMGPDTQPRNTKQSTPRKQERRNATDGRRNGHQTQHGFIITAFHVKHGSPSYASREGKSRGVPSARAKPTKRPRHSPDSASCSQSDPVRHRPILTCLLRQLLFHTECLTRRLCVQIHSLSVGLLRLRLRQNRHRTTGPQHTMHEPFFFSREQRERVFFLCRERENAKGRMGMCLPSERRI